MLYLQGGALGTTGIAANTVINASNLRLNTTGAINLGSNAHTINFTASDIVAWPGTSLTISGWQGTPGSSGTGGKIFFGTNNTGLTPAQLAKISFSGFTGATLLSTGELVPTGSSNSTNITSFSASPNNGTATSGYVGSTVTVTGIGFTGVTDVKYGGSSGTAIAGFTVVNDNTITFTAPAGMDGVIYVSGSNGNSTSTSSFTNLGYITSSAGDMATAGTWLGGSAPPNGSTATVNHNVTVYRSSQQHNNVKRQCFKKH
jgi:hypothetical protein